MQVEDINKHQESKKGNDAWCETGARVLQLGWALATINLKCILDTIL